MSVKTRRIQSIMFIIVAVLTAVTVLCMLVGYIVDSFFFTLDDLPVGKKVAAVANDKGNRTVTVYSVENPLGNAVRAEVYDAKTGTTKNFFWETDAKLQNAEWIDNRIININGHFVDVVSDTYDSRRPIIDEPYSENGKQQVRHQQNGAEVY